MDRSGHDEMGSVRSGQNDRSPQKRANRILEHVLKDVKEVFSGHMLRHNAKRVDIRTGAVHAQPIRPKREYLPARSTGSCFRQSTSERDCANEFLDEGCYPPQDYLSVKPWRLVEERLGSNASKNIPPATAKAVE